MITGFDSCPLEVNGLYHSCFVRFQEISIHYIYLRLCLHGTSLFPSKNLASHASEATTFFAMNDTRIHLNQMFSLI